MQKYHRKKPSTVFSVSELINVAYYILPSGYVFHGEQHDFWELGYVQKGRFGLTIDGEYFELSAGDIDICRPNVFHASKTLGDEPVNVVVLAFDGEILDGGTFDKKVLHLGEEEQQCLDTIIREASQTYSNFNGAPGPVKLIRKEDSPFGSEQIVKNRLEELFVYLHRHNNPQSEPKKMVCTSDVVERVLEYIDSHYGEKITLQILADKHNISVTHLKRVFKEEMGKTVLTYLTEVRIREAKRLIREGKLDFGPIGRAVGFDSIYYFSDVFKKKTGMPPTEYARKMRENG